MTAPYYENGNPAWWMRLSLKEFRDELRKRVFIGWDLAKIDDCNGGYWRKLYEQEMPPHDNITKKQKAWHDLRERCNRGGFEIGKTYQASDVFVKVQEPPRMVTITTVVED